MHANLHSKYSTSGYRRGFENEIIEYMSLPFRLRTKLHDL